MLPDLPALTLLALAGICLFTATVQGVVGFGFALLAVPLSALVEPSAVPVPQAILSVFLTLPMAWRGRHHLELRRVRWILLGWIPGVVIGVTLLKVLSVRAVSLAMAAFVLGAVALMTLGLKVRRYPPTEVGAGVLAGLGSLVSSISGPPVALLYKDERGPTLRANLALVFLSGVLLTLGGRLVSGEISLRDAQIALCVAPGVLLSLPVAERLGGKVDGALLRRLVLGLATLSAVALAARAL